MVKLAIVILNWNGKNFLEKFLPSVCKYSANSDYKIIVADNASSDDSIEYVKTNFADVEIIKFDKNFGFAGGYNKALKLIKAQYYMILNSDVEVTQNWLSPLIDYLDNNKDVACCMPKVLAMHDNSKFEYAGASGGFIDKYGYPFCRGRIFDSTETDEGQYDEIIDIFWATGAALMIRSEIFHQINGFDEDFFAHMEEIDLCWRIKNLGFRIVCIPQSIVYHVGGGALPKESPFKTFLNFRNNLYLLYKNLGTKNFHLIIFQRKTLDGIAGIKFLLSGNFANFFAIIKAHFSYYKNIKYLKKKRYQNLILYPPQKHKEIYGRSIVTDFYLRKKTKFSELIF